MSDQLKHECGIALIRLLKPLEFYKEKYGTAFYGVQKMYLLMEKQHNRGQDGAGFASIKLDVEPGERYISRVRSNQAQPIQDVFAQINDRINEELTKHPEYANDIALQKANIPYIGELFLGHVRYGTFGKNSIESVHPFLRQNNWMHRNLILAGNFNMTNVKELFNGLVELGQHPKEMTDTVTVMEKIGHFLDNEVTQLYQECKNLGLTKREASPYIAENLNLAKILHRASKNLDGGYAMAGLLGHGDAFVFRDPAGIRPAYYYKDDEIVVVASERPVIQTVFNVAFDKVQEIEPGNALIIKKNGLVSTQEILTPTIKKACSFERIYFSRGSDAEIYQERKKLGKLILPAVLKAIDDDTDNTVFSYIPNTAETSFYGMVEAAQDFLNQRKNNYILANRNKLTKETLQELLEVKIRMEKVAIKDAKLRTFITEDASRDDLVAHVYDVTYGVIQPNDNLVIIDDSIVRGTTLKMSIIKMMDRLNPKKIVIVSSAPQIRYPDCYGIDMAKLEGLIAFRAALELLKQRNMYHIVQEVYDKCKAQENLKDAEMVNYVTQIYDPFEPQEISDQIAKMLTSADIKAEVKIIFQTVEDLHLACPKNLGDWYFTGNYPTPGGNRVVNRAFMNFYEGKDARAY
ncbi:amidophosphoribosyltransferase [Flavobacterium branchiophilum NBRC 15030 = ATCC 35035]|uniref:Amidophosphoribosyltransferase n=2 Tax=Flavobacterium branchiophilum TaxID=55197 RepID=G2Z6B7_FLABF|nr:amidophosphoribosyltransferase [Flavobacterium branchiophilum]OXA79186.1 amidophosphoribosyltransferase [Flavobacterium branchiophilum NBRC 15030 = ATCC 35035]PDS23492.1 amidophosphoribosyltransferase [Flavobacterium branchiophilum]TQM40331.1 amidophosphoribosyltransferase [Flavobacterium branchiophilum]CCB70937.1 Amidophosphoribosyltransferase [Flavobacterium branchiophilum FL-15]GEM56540.1 amidophosphoribosyltransferase [Flavobacterium branchiophilum NBRC 15030 = ATCC 35035]